MKVEQAVDSMKKSLIWENWSDDQADSIRTLLFEVEKVKVLEEENSALRSRTNEYKIINDYKELLNTRYESFKKTLFAENFVPDALEVWKMYSHAFYENNGAYYYIQKLLGFELYTPNGRLNEFCIYLNNINKNFSNLCSEYVLKILPQLPQTYNSTSENESHHELEQ
jgi:hypothetical protein